jgi:hypothetical protein
MPIRRETSPISFSIDREQGIVFEIWRGAITAAHVRRYWETLLSNADALAFRRTLADLREANLQLTGKELSGLVSEVVIPMLNGLDWRTAIVVARPAQFGVSRQYQVFAQTFSTDQIFYDPDEALRWLR